MQEDAPPHAGARCGPSPPSRPPTPGPTAALQDRGTMHFCLLSPAAGGVWSRRPEDTNTPPTGPKLRGARARQQTEAPAKGQAQPLIHGAPPARRKPTRVLVPTLLFQEKRNTPVLNIFINGKMIVIALANVSLRV